MSRLTTVKAGLLTIAALLSGCASLNSRREMPSGAIVHKYFSDTATAGRTIAFMTASFFKEAQRKEFCEVLNIQDSSIEVLREDSLLSLGLVLRHDVKTMKSNTGFSKAEKEAECPDDQKIVSMSISGRGDNEFRWTLDHKNDFEGGLFDIATGYNSKGELVTTTRRLTADVLTIASTAFTTLSLDDLERFSQTDMILVATFSDGREESITVPKDAILKLRKIVAKQAGARG